MNADPMTFLEVEARKRFLKRQAKQLVEQEKAERKNKKREVIYCFYDPDFNDWDSAIREEFKRLNLTREDYRGGIICLPENGIFTKKLRV